MAQLNIVTKGIRGYQELNVLGVIPPQDDEPDRGFKDCCYTNMVFASSSDSSPEFNDYKGFLFERPADNYDIVFSISDDQFSTEEIIVNDGKYGELYDFGDIETLPRHKGFRVDFRKVLQNGTGPGGEGDFQFKIDFQVSSVSQGFILSNTFTLREFSYQLADHTTRIESIQNGTLQRGGRSFLGANWADMIRVPGYFGNRQNTREDIQWIGSDFEKRKNLNQQNSTYRFEATDIPICIYNEVVDYHMMAQEIFMSDYNSNNIDYCLFRIPVNVENIEETNYTINTRRCKLNYVLSERFGDNRMTIC